MEDTRKILEQAIASHQAGRFTEAASGYRRVLEFHPDSWDAQYLLGTVLLQLGEFHESAEWLARVVVNRPDIPDAQNNLGVAYKAIGQWQEAAKTFESTIRAHPEYEQAYHNLGSLMEDRGLWADAEKCYRRALAINDADFQTQYSLGNVLKAQKKWSDAEEIYRVALSLEKRNLDVYVNLAFALVKQERLDDAIEIYQQILDVKPDYYQVFSSLSYVFERVGQFEEAEQALASALKVNPDYADAFNNLGVVRRSQHRFDEAIACFESAIRCKPDFALAHFNRATTQLLVGDFENGWVGYEERHRAVNEAIADPLQASWNGSEVPDKTLIVYSDQGFGDAFQFARFLKEAKQRSRARVVLQCQSPLLNLMRGIEGVDEVVPEGREIAETDAKIALSSLPGVFHAGADAIGMDTPYLTAARELKPRLAEALAAASPDYPKVGLYWQGNPEQGRDVLRSCALSFFEPLLEVAGVSFFSLQVESSGLDQLTASRFTDRITEVGSHFDEFDDTAAFLQQLDLLITVDTAVAHLAGALGRRVWTLLCHTPDWRWLLDRTDSPWYPSMTLFRQPRWGDWHAVVQSVKQELSQLGRS